MYRVDGSSDLTEFTLDHFAGYRDSWPVRIGNGASDQLQLDIYGEALNSLQALDGGLLGSWGIGHDGWKHVVTLIEWLCDHWREPEEGIWEARGAAAVRSCTGSSCPGWHSIVSSAWPRAEDVRRTSLAG